MKTPDAFGARTPTQVTVYILQQGAWSRCLECRKGILPKKGQVTDADKASDAALQEIQELEGGLEKLQCVACKAHKTQYAFAAEVLEPPVQRETAS